MHQVIHLLQLTHTNNLDRSLDKPPAEEIKCFRGIFAVTDVGAFDSDASDDGLEYGCFEECTCWQTDGHN